MTEEKKLKAIEQIFDIGWNCRLTLCCAEWLRNIMRKQYWKIGVIPFINKITEKKWKDDLRTVYHCGYFEDFNGRNGFKDIYIKKGSHQNLHQAIHCLNKYRGIPFENIDVEQPFYNYEVDILGKMNSRKHVVVELGELSSYEKFWLIYDSLVKEFWFDGKGKFLYSLRASGELPIEEHPFEHMFDFFQEKCKGDLGQFWECSRYSYEISNWCHSARNSVPERRRTKAIC
jgi:hypothetical protein